MPIQSKPLPRITPRAKKKFFARVAKSKPNSCWMWKGALGRRGYGMVGLGYRMVYAHRVAYFLARGEDPVGPDTAILHTCDTPGCCNPKHLYVGSHLDNMRDCKSRMRHRYGERNEFAKLTEVDVAFIRASFTGVPGKKNNPTGCYGLAKKFRVSYQTISRVVNGHTWRHSL